jgi:DNA-binding NtrC family response regulator
MIAIAIVGIGIEVYRLAAVAQGHRRTARIYALQASNHHANLRKLETLIAAVESQLHTAALDTRKRLLRKAATELRIETEELIPRLKKTTALRIRYERAALRPWESVQP